MQAASALFSCAWVEETMRGIRSVGLVLGVTVMLLGSTVGTSAASIPSIPNVPGLPYINVGFPCHAPEQQGIGGNGLVTMKSFVLLWDQTQNNLPALFGSHHGDFNKLKCLFIYPPGTIPNTPYTLHDFPCDYSSDQTGRHVFADSEFFARPTWALLLCTGTANNTAPVANDDTYDGGAVSGETFIVSAADGVLANDTDADSDQLSAVLVTGPSHGTLTLNPDGSFTYTNDGETGQDSFTYKANDGSADSNVATVTIYLECGQQNTSSTVNTVTTFCD
jgi:VCBS repeat-containing protein